VLLIHAKELSSENYLDRNNVIHKIFIRSGSLSHSEIKVSYVMNHQYSEICSHMDV
jgi:hypothetical protein